MKTKAKFWYNRYKYYRDKLNTLISKSKKNHLQKYFQENYHDSKKTWQKTTQSYSKIWTQKNLVIFMEFHQTDKNSSPLFSRTIDSNL